LNIIGARIFIVYFLASDVTIWYSSGKWTKANSARSILYLNSPEEIDYPVKNFSYM